MKDKRFSVWKKRFREIEAAQFVEIAVQPDSEPAAERLVSPAVERRAIEVRLARGQSLMVEPGFDARHLRALLTVLEA